MARLGGWAWGLGRWLQGSSSFNSGTVGAVLVEKNIGRRCCMGLWWNFCWRWAPVGRQAGLLWCAWAGHAEGTMQEQLCSSAEPTKEQGKNLSKTFTQQKMLRGGPRYRSRRQVEQRGIQPHPHDGRRQSRIRPFTPHSSTACGDNKQSVPESSPVKQACTPELSCS